MFEFHFFTVLLPVEKLQMTRGGGGFLLARAAGRGGGRRARSALSPPLSDRSGVLPREGLAGLSDEQHLPGTGHSFPRPRSAQLPPRR